MRSVKRIFLVGLLLALAPGLTEGLPGSTATASKPTEVVCGTTSSKDREQMILTGNLFCTGTAVTITHNNVHLNMRGFTIDGDLTGRGIEVRNVNDVDGVCGPQLGPSGAHINGGTVKEFDHGIFLCRSSNALVNGITATLNDLAGILVDRGPGNAGNHMINGSTLSFNGCRSLIDGVPACQPGEVFEGGLVLITSTGNAIHTMNVHDNARYGVLFRTSSNNTITSSQLIDNAVTGIFSDRAGGNIIRGNNIAGSVQGINVSAGGGGDIIQSNTSTNNGDGFHIRSLRNSVVRSNTATNNNFGIRVFGNSFGNLLQNNTALSNGTDLNDANTAGAPLPCNNTWKSNIFVTASGAVACIQ